MLVAILSALSASCGEALPDAHTETAAANGGGEVVAARVGGPAAPAVEPRIVLTTGEQFTVAEYTARVQAQVWWNGYRLTCDSYLDVLRRLKSEEPDDENIQRGITVYEDVCAAETATHIGWRALAGDH